MSHAGISNRTKVNLRYIDSEDIENKGTELLEGCDAILVPGGFGLRGVEGKTGSLPFNMHARTRCHTWVLPAWACK